MKVTIAEMKKQVDLLDYVRDNGCNVEKVGDCTYRINPCPVCGHEDRADA